MIYNCALGYTLPQLEVSTLTFLVTSKTLVIGVNEFVLKKMWIANNVTKVILYAIILRYGTELLD